jgi:hypothetical protein
MPFRGIGIIVGSPKSSVVVKIESQTLSNDGK